MIRSFFLILAGIALFFIVGKIGIILYDIPFKQWVMDDFIGAFLCILVIGGLLRE